MFFMEVDLPAATSAPGLVFSLVLEAASQPPTFSVTLTTLSPPFVVASSSVVAVVPNSNVCGSGSSRWELRLKKRTIRQRTYVCIILFHLLCSAFFAVCRCRGDRFRGVLPPESTAPESGTPAADGAASDTVLAAVEAAVAAPIQREEVAERLLLKLEMRGGA